MSVNMGNTKVEARPLRIAQQVPGMGRITVDIKDPEYDENYQLVPGTYEAVVKKG